MRLAREVVLSATSHVLVPLDVDVTAAFQASFFAPDCIAHSLGLLNLALAKGDLARLHGLLAGLYLLLMHRHTDGFALANGHIRDVALSRMALNIDFLVGDRHLQRL